MNSCFVRNAILSDAFDLLPLIAQLGYPTDELSLKKRLEFFIITQGYGVAVAQCNQEIVGFIAWSGSKLFISDKARVRIEALIVDEHFRGQKVGERLIAFFEKSVSVHGPVLIELTSGARRAQDGAHRFYHKLGYSNEGVTEKVYLRKEL